jgi:hypothetical protein
MINDDGAVADLRLLREKVAKLLPRSLKHN